MSRAAEHGLCIDHKRHPLYTIFYNIKTRCYNASKHNYPYYQGKGIEICDEWVNSVKNFYDWALSAGWVKGLTIDRIDSSQNYSPENCRWITREANSKRSCVLNGIGKKLSLEQVASIKLILLTNKNCAAIGRNFGVSKQTIHRIRDNRY
jgi:hypothetical protein